LHLLKAFRITLQCQGSDCSSVLVAARHTNVGFARVTSSWREAPMGPSTRHALSGWQGSSKLTANVCLSTIGSPECRTPFESTPVLRMKPVSNISSSQEVLGAADGKHQPQPCPSVDQPRPYASNLSAPPPLTFSSKNQSQIPMKKAEPPIEDGSNRSGKRTWRGSIRSF
jgi:hypothetical protein